MGMGYLVRCVEYKREAEDMISKRQRRLAAKKEFKLPVTKFEAIDLETTPFVPQGMTRAFRNTRYIVMIYDRNRTTHGNAIRVMVQRHDDRPIPNHWSEMQSIKNEIFGAETVAVEYYPAESKLINTHNIYWLWIYPEEILPIPIF